MNRTEITYYVQALPTYPEGGHPESDTPCVYVSEVVWTTSPRKVAHLANRGVRMYGTPEEAESAARVSNRIG